MALFEPHRSRDTEEILGSDAATRALSVTDVESDFVASVYERISSVYDFTFGPALHPGRVDAIERMAIRAGDRVLEVGVGTGINAALYPRDCAVTGIDFSAPMLVKARKRIRRKGVSNVRLLEIYAPYVISVVPDPVAVAREMCRVCRPGGRVVILNHFRSMSRVGSWLEKIIAPFTLYIGFKSDVDLPAFLVQADLKPVSIEKVNVPRIWSLVTYIKP
jgi:phosphatidylethanolamine/phosphatidyl-N-methylethanolamine N-methyltransferase